MSTISVSLPSDGSTADVSDYNTPITTIITDYNGSIDNSNISASAAIATSKLADDGGITTAKVGSGFVVQTVSAMFGSASTGTTTIPLDTTIPQNTEGDQYMTLSITPKSTTNHLFIEAKLYAAHSVAVDLIAALFQDSTANALAATSVYQATATGRVNLLIGHDMAAGTTSSTTFKVRAGGSAAGTFSFNPQSYFGGISLSYLRITEYRP